MLPNAQGHTTRKAPIVGLFWSLLQLALGNRFMIP